MKVWKELAAKIKPLGKVLTCTNIWCIRNIRNNNLPIQTSIFPLIAASWRGV